MSTATNSTRPLTHAHVIDDREENIVKPNSKRKKIVRLVLNQDKRLFSPIQTRNALEKCAQELENQSLTAKYLITPGGFIGFKASDIETTSPGWNTSFRDVKKYIRMAEEMIAKIMNRAITYRLKKLVRYITFGIDSKNDIHTNHVELVIVYDVKNEKSCACTGKSYPIKDQEKHLLRVSNLKTHFCRFGGERVLILGCHDLNIFSPRVQANLKKGSPRSETVKKFKTLTKEFAPNIVLHHPHLTDSSRIWQQGWAGINVFLKNPVYASSLRVKRSRNRSKKLNIQLSTVSSRDIVEDIII